MSWRRYLSRLKEFDWVLLGAVVLLIGFGLAALYSIAISAENPDFLNFKKQVTFASVGIILVFILSLIDYRVWIYLSQVIYGLALILLTAVLFFGRTISGTTGWFSFLGFSFQPIEIAKLALIILLAWFLSRKVTLIKDFKNFLLSGLLAAALFVLVLLQPDLGSALILFVIWLAMLWLAGAQRKHLLAVAALLAVVAVLRWFFFLQPHQKERILTFVNPGTDPYGRGYQVRQAVIAVGAGGLLGRGLGFGSQSQLKFIPASQTDFIFAVIAEELGLLGVGLVLFLWGLIFYRLARAVANLKDSFAIFYILGLSALFFGQIFINLGMNIGLVPVTGIPLPFLSYGGSFLLVSLIAIGLVESMIIRSRS